MLLKIDYLVLSFECQKTRYMNPNECFDFFHFCFITLKIVAWCVSFHEGIFYLEEGVSESHEFVEKDFFQWSPFPFFFFSCETKLGIWPIRIFSSQ